MPTAPAEFTERIRVAIENESKALLEIPLRQEEIIAKFVVSAAILVKGFEYEAEEVGALFEFAVNKLQLSCQKFKIGEMDS